MTSIPHTRPVQRGVADTVGLALAGVSTVVLSAVLAYQLAVAAAPRPTTLLVLHAAATGQAGAQQVSGLSIIRPALVRAPGEVK